MTPEQGYLKANFPSFMDELSKMARVAPQQVRKGTSHVGTFADFKESLKPGDIIVTKPSTLGRKSSLSPIIRAYDALTGAKHPGWVHTSLYLGDGRLGHLDDKKLSRGKVKPRETPALGYDRLELFDKTKYDLVALRHRSKKVATTAVKRMTEYVKSGRNVGNKTYLKNFLRTGFNVPGTSTADAVCTGLVGEAFRGGALSQRDPLVMRPKDFMESKKLRHVVAYDGEGEKIGK